jgi:hypothetical protein
LKEGGAMNIQVITDKLLDLTQNHAEAIAEQWYKAVSSNPRTPSYHSLTTPQKERLLLQTKILLQALKKLYFAEKPYQEIERIFESTGFVHDACSRGIPMAETVYAVVLMRRHIWLYADTQEMIKNALDEYLVVESINRTLLLFDYAVQIVLENYQLMHKKESHPVGKH